MKPARLALFLSLLLPSACVTVAPENLPEPDYQQAAKVNVQLGVRYMQQGKYDLAMDKLQKALEQDDEDPDVHTALAVLNEQMGDAAAAREHYNEAYDLAPDDPSIQNNFGAFLCRQGEYEDSVEYFAEAARNPQYNTPAAAWTNAGICAERIPDLRQAEQYYRQALQIDPKFRDALLQLAELSYQQQKDLQARAFLQRLDAAGAMTPAALWLGYQVEMRLGDRRAARQYAGQLLRDYPDTPEAQKLREARG